MKNTEYPNTLSYAALFLCIVGVNNNGARELDRAIDTYIKQAIADEILFGKLRNGGSANVDLSKKDDEFTFKFTPMQKPTKKHLETN